MATNEPEKSLLAGLVSFCTTSFNESAIENNSRLGFEGAERQRSKGVGVRRITGSLEAERHTKHTQNKTNLSVKVTILSSQWQSGDWKQDPGGHVLSYTDFYLSFMWDNMAYLPTKSIDLFCSGRDISKRKHRYVSKITCINSFLMFF